MGGQVPCVISGLAIVVFSEGGGLAGLMLALCMPRMYAKLVPIIGSRRSIVRWWQGKGSRFHQLLPRQMQYSSNVPIYPATHSGQDATEHKQREE